MVKNRNYKYKTICQDCGNEFPFYRSYPLSKKQLANLEVGYHKERRYCDNCRDKRLRQLPGKNSRSRQELYYIDSKGYAFLRVNGTFVPEHRIVMERMLGRPLQKGESVHHKNGVRHNNSSQNLELWVKPQQLAGQRASDLICPHCGKSYSSI